MINRNIVEEYQCMNSVDRTAFRRWLTINTVVGACLFTLVAITAIFSGGESSSNIAGNGGAVQHAEAR
jgi:hypothetical protein